MFGFTALLPTFSFKEVEAALATSLRIVDESGKRATFTSRLQQLQKLGLPWGANSGRGIRVRYTVAQIAETLFYCDLLDVGWTPALIATHFRDQPVHTGQAWAKIVIGLLDRKQNCWIVLTPNALEYLRDENLNRAEPSALETVWMLSVGERYDTSYPLPVVLINLSRRLGNLAQCLGIAPSSIVT